MTLIRTPDDEDRERAAHKWGSFEWLWLTLAVLAGLALVEEGLHLLAPKIKPDFHGGIGAGVDP